jgi:hypothetical protein
VGRSIDPMGLALSWGHEDQPDTAGGQHVSGAEAECVPLSFGDGERCGVDHVDESGWVSFGTTISITRAARTSSQHRHEGLRMFRANR